MASHKQRDDVNRQLLVAAREAREILHLVMLAEVARKLRGPYTDAWEKLNAAIGEAEKEIRDAKDRGA